MAEDEAQKLFNEGTDYYGGGMYQQALDACDKAQAILDPNNLLNAGVWTLRGLVLVDLGRHQEAVKSFDNAIAIDPNNEVAWSSKATALLHLGRYQEAVESYEEVLKLDPESKDAWEGRAGALNQLEEWLKAHRPPNLYVEPYQLVGGTEKRLHNFICLRLKKELGDDESQWWVKGIPLTIRHKCDQRWEDNFRREPAHNYTDFIDLKDILDKNWRLFEGDFQAIKSQFKTKNEFLNDLVRLNEIRKTVMHPVRSLPTGDDIDLARRMREVIEQFCGPG